jgi:hypothetical protein
MDSNLIDTITTKEEDCIIFFKYKYYKKGNPNKDGSQRYVCCEKKCYSSMTKCSARGGIFKINGAMET